jgi:hypothetical protein
LKIKSQQHFWSGVMFIALGIAFAWGATEYDFGSTANPGPGYFPFGLGVLLALLGAVILFTALTIETEGGEPIGAVAWRPFFVILGSVVLFGAALPRLGLIVTLPLMIILASFAGEGFRWASAIASAVVLTALSYAAFIWGLGLVIPVWPTVFGG